MEGPPRLPGESSACFHPSNWNMPVIDLTQWEAHIPGIKNTPWEGGVYSLQVTFSRCSSECVPRFRFLRPLLHPNVYPSGTWARMYMGDVKPYETQTCKHDTWARTKQEDAVRFATFLRNLQKALNEPDIANPAQSDAYTLAKNNFKTYEEKIRAQAEAWKPDPLTGLAGRPILQPVKQEA
ncbi:ubiquitin-conjugating enzyme/RWD-like protein [Mycena latifolia]|nr:ubiquitin-conjugating enzyme/RWD-like protein [Mycena latifolia]